MTVPVLVQSYFPPEFAKITKAAGAGDHPSHVIGLR